MIASPNYVNSRTVLRPGSSGALSAGDQVVPGDASRIALIFHSDSGGFRVWLSAAGSQQTGLGINNTTNPLTITMADFAGLVCQPWFVTKVDVPPHVLSWIEVLYIPESGGENA